MRYKWLFSLSALILIHFKWYLGILWHSLLSFRSFASGCFGLLLFIWYKGEPVLVFFVFHCLSILYSSARFQARYTFECFPGICVWLLFCRKFVNFIYETKDCQVIESNAFSTIFKQFLESGTNIWQITLAYRC